MSDATDKAIRAAAIAMQDRGIDFYLPPVRAARSAVEAALPILREEWEAQAATHKGNDHQ